VTTTYSRGSQVPPAFFAAPVPSAQTLYSMAELLLNRALACLLEKGLEAPARQVIYMSPIPADCEQLAVLFDGWSPDHPWDNTTNCNSFRWLAGFAVAITRCTPAIPSRKGAAPTVTQMKAAAQMASDDAEALICVVSSLDEIGSELSIVTASPQGGFQTTELRVTFPAFGALQ
jgi:hypothetical protein